MQWQQRSFGIVFGTPGHKDWMRTWKFQEGPYRIIEIKLRGMSGIDKNPEVRENLCRRTKSENYARAFGSAFGLLLCLQILPSCALKSNSPWQGGFPLLSLFATAWWKMSPRAFL